MAIESIAYTTEALSTGSGRLGHVRSTDGALEFEMTPPKALGGSGEGTNPALPVLECIDLMDQLP